MPLSYSTHAFNLQPQGPAAAAKANKGGIVPKEDDLEEVEAEAEDDE